ETEEQLEELLSQPSPADVAFLARLTGDVAVLGAGGKMGPSLARRVRRANDEAASSRRVAAVSRVSSPEVARALEAEGVDAITCDLLDPVQVQRLPYFENVLFLAGMKFGASERPDLTWALNTIVPALVARRYATSRIVVFSTGNVYPLVPPASGGSLESDLPGPVGEYAQSCLGRERIFEHGSRERLTPCLLFRLFYAVDLRYGVLVDVARKLFAGEPIDLAVGHVNVIWQGDASSYALRSLGLTASPPRVLNVTGPEVVAVRDVAERFGRRFGRAARFQGTEGETALLGNAAACRSLLGEPSVSLDRLVEWVARWVETGGRSLGKPTKYERADGRF
ncbi:MAG TPA: NAD-dependent epimerase/dehydratase family protein, partial [Vicinamibacteria bacterium]|nr:NAD-dependent epimerase/dehydratase family protein [Vicinamibacteria bacterium]